MLWYKNERIERRELGHRQFYDTLCGTYFYVEELSHQYQHIVVVNMSRNLIAQNWNTPAIA